MNGRRILELSARVLVHWWAPGEHGRYSVVKDPLPPDVRIVSAVGQIPDLDGPGSVLLLLESSEWEEVPEGASIPRLDPQIWIGPIPDEEQS